MNPIVEKILHLAVNAPSGDNSQPWQFQSENLKFDIINLPYRDNPIFNFQQRGSLIAHGALIQNIILLAPVFGYEAKIELLPKKQKSDIIATVTLLPTSKQVEKTNICELIQNRVTNRKKYQNIKLTNEQKQQLLETRLENNLADLLLIENKDKIMRIAQASSAAERIMLEYQPLHQAFFSMVRWNKSEEAKEKCGMFIDTLELKPPQKLIFKWFSNWKKANILRKIGMPTFVAKENSKIYSSAATVAAIVMPNTEPENFIRTGMILQNFWLKATELSLSLQPMAGVLYLEQNLMAGGLNDLNANLKSLVTNSVQNIYNAFGNPRGIITMLFRLGKSNSPSACSAKFPPVINLKQNV